MTPERWRQVEGLYHKALETPLPERARRLGELCAGDDELQQEVESLLAQEGATGFLEVPAPVAASGLEGTPRAPLVGRRLGPYVIQSPLGVGGMGEVYRARDTTLGRDVAIKVLPAVFAADPERLRRLKGEARLLAALNHPHIGAIYGFEEADGLHGLVLELVEGPTLAERLGQAEGLPIDEALAIARQVAEALDAAHEKGIVHRDLKPANIKLTPGGVVKVLDFGLAKVALAVTPDSWSSPTLGKGETREGTILGTVAYMSPEQARGQAVDKRMDVWAFGCVLFEMLAGRAPFTAETLADTLAAIVEREPSWSALPDTTPSGVSRLLRRCLEKDPRRRLRDIADAQDDLTRAGDADVITKRGVFASSGTGRAHAALSALSIAAVIAASVAAGFWLRQRPSSDAHSTPVRFSVPPPQGGEFVGDPGRAYLALSPDGSQLAFIAAEPAGDRRIWLRAISAIDARPLSGTEGANSLFWSPDGRSVAFFAGNKLKRLDLPQGAAVPVCDALDIALSGTWGAGEILFASVEGDAIFSVSALGGAPAALVKADRSRGERVSWPWFLPDGRRFLYLSRLGDGSGQLTLGERGRTPRPVLRAMSSVQWVDPDYLVFVREGTLVGQRFDLASERIVGEPFFIAEPVDYFLSSARATFATSRNGNLAYQSHQDIARLVWSDRNGTRIGDVGTPGDYRSVRISPDGRTLLFARTQPGVGTPDLWTLDIRRGVETRLTSDPGSESKGVWLADGHGVVFLADRGGLPHLFRKSLLTGAEDELLPVGQRQIPDEVSPDGRTLAFSQGTARGKFDLLTLSLPTPGAPSVLAGSRFNERGLRFSPDGRAVVFLSDESGRDEGYAAPFPAMVPKTRISTAGARQAQWSPAGRELLHLTNEGGMVSVPVRTEPSLELGTPATLFVLPERPRWGEFAVSRDGKRFLSIVFDVLGGEQPVTVVLDWPAEVGRP